VFLAGSAAIVFERNVRLSFILRLLLIGRGKSEWKSGLLVSEESCDGFCGNHCCADSVFLTELSSKAADGPQAT
jgi:hypothetical protein